MTPPPPALRGSAIYGVVSVLIILALGAAIFAVISTARSVPRATARSTATSTGVSSSPFSTPVPSALQPPIHGTGLPEGVEVDSFMLTGPYEGWGAGEVITNPVSGFPDRSMVLHYTAGSWVQVGPTLPGLSLGGIDMISSSEGWAVGTGDGDNLSFMIHISNGTWQRVALPPDPGASAAVLAMRTPNEGWMAMANVKGAYTGANTSLFHYANGVWSLVKNSLKYITDIAPVADGEAWVTGWNADASSSLVHVVGGQATVELRSPGDTTFDHLRMFAPNDIWIEGAMHDSGTNADIDDVPINYHFDGVAWSNVNLQAPSTAQHASIVSSNTAWSYISVQPTLPQDTSAWGEIASIYANFANGGGQWQALTVPYKDLMTIEVVSSSSTDVWAIGEYMLTVQVPDNRGDGGKSYASIGHHVLLHYVGGTWTEYGR